MILLLPVFNNVLTVSTETLAGALANLTSAKELNTNSVFKNIILDNNLDVNKIISFLTKHFQRTAPDGEIYYYQFEHNSRHFHITGYEEELFVTDVDIELGLDDESSDCIITNFAIDSLQTSLLTILLTAMFTENQDDKAFFEDCMTAKSCLIRSYDTNTEVSIELPDNINSIEDFFNSFFKNEDK
jgi:hypothetical protein